MSHAGEIARMAAEVISAAFPFQAHHVEVHGSRIHYVDEGTGEPVLFLHGTATWSYLWRNVIPHLAPHARCIAPDLIGMGRSDKPRIEYRFFDHMRYLDGFIERLGLKRIVLVGLEWGASLGSCYAMRHEAHIRGLAFMEPLLMPILRWEDVPQNVVAQFRAFRTPAVGWDLIVDQNMLIEQVLPSLVARGLTEEEMKYYREPFLEKSSRTPLWRCINEIPFAGEPVDVTEVVNAYNQWLQQSPLPKLVLHATPGFIMQAPQVAWARQYLPNLKAVDIGRGVLYLPEDQPHRVGEELAGWYRTL